ncbi:hypothetical protein [Streptomyces sp. NPDC057623]|uniref:hypothetical protein n=1 Tax=Streptomyces sp. NPDC057623 TaxID=3346187 RepID=UPI0036954EE2
MRASTSVKKRVVSVLVAGGLSLGALVGTAGAAQAAVCADTPCYSVTGTGKSLQAAQNDAINKAKSRCGSRTVLDQNQSLAQQRSDGTVVYTMYFACR